MDDLIRRQDAISVLNAKCKKAFDLTCGEEDCACAEYMALRDLPSGRKIGQWEDEETNYLCSVCHRGCWVNSDFCPWCGSDMRSESDG